MLKKPKATAPDVAAQKQSDENKEILFKKEWFIKNNTDAVLQRYSFANVLINSSRKLDKEPLEKFTKPLSLELIL
jgi:hypothetical protein